MASASPLQSKFSPLPRHSLLAWLPHTLGEWEQVRSEIPVSFVRVKWTLYGQERSLNWWLFSVKSHQDQWSQCEITLSLCQIIWMQRYWQKSCVPPENAQSEQNWIDSSPFLVLDKVRAQIQARGAKTIRGLGRTFRNFDSFDGNKKIDKVEFYSGLCEIQIKITQAEAAVSQLPR